MSGVLTSVRYCVYIYIYIYILFKYVCFMATNKVLQGQSSPVGKRRLWILLSHRCTNSQKCVYKCVYILGSILVLKWLYLLWYLEKWIGCLLQTETYSTVTINKNKFTGSSQPFFSSFIHRQFVFSAFTEEFISAPFTEQIYNFFVPALSDPKLAFPFQNFLWSLQATIASSAQARAQAPWLFYFVLSVGESGLGK